MKILFFAFLLVAVSAKTLPEEKDIQLGNRQQRLITNQIRNAIEGVSASIREAGLDPVDIPLWEYQNVPIPFVTLNAIAENVSLKGLSNIAINSLDFNLFLSRLRFDVSLPLVAASVGNAAVSADVFGNQFGGDLSGSLSVANIRLGGEVRVNIGIISGITIRDLSITFSVGNIASAISLNVLGNDWSDTVNNALNEGIPNLLEANRAQINQFLTDLVRELIEQALGNSVIVQELTYS